MSGAAPTFQAERSATALAHANVAVDALGGLVHEGLGTVIELLSPAEADEEEPEEEQEEPEPEPEPEEEPEPLAEPEPEEDDHAGRESGVIDGEFTQASGWPKPREEE